MCKLLILCVLLKLIIGGRLAAAGVQQRYYGLLAFLCTRLNKARNLHLFPLVSGPSSSVLVANVASLLEWSELRAQGAETLSRYNYKYAIWNRVLFPRGFDMARGEAKPWRAISHPRKQNEVPYIAYIPYYYIYTFDGILVIVRHFVFYAHEHYS